MATKVTQTSGPSSQKSALTHSDVHGRLRDKSVEVLQSIVGDNLRRLNYNDDITLLEKGIFYPCEYFAALQEQTQTARLEFFKGKDSFFHGYVSPKYFRMEPDANGPSGKKVACFVLKEGVLPSEALKSMRDGLSLMGCAEVCQIAQYAAIEDVLGSDKFNALFAADTKTPLMIGTLLPNNPISRLRVYLMKKDAAEADIKKGDLVFIQNADSYYSKHLTGGAGGYNSLCIDDTAGAQKFTALAFPPEGYSYDQAKDYLISEYNTPYVAMNSYTEKTKQALFASFGEERISLSKELEATQVTHEEFKKQNGGKITIVCELDTVRITQLANSTLKEARKLLDGYDVRIGNRTKADLI